MRNATVIITGILILAAGSALAEDFRDSNPSPAPLETAESSLVSGMAVLQVSPMYMEIKEILDQSTRAEKTLLLELAAATDELQCQVLIAQIEKLDLQRDLDIMAVQARYAHEAGRWDLEKQIRSRILDLQEGRIVAAR